MNRAGVVVLLLVTSRIAAADDPAVVASETAQGELVARAASEAATDGARGIVGVDAVLSASIVDTLQGEPTGWTLDASARAELAGSGAGGEASASAAVTARGLLDPAVTDGRAPLEVTAAAGLSRRPGLADPRRGMRDVTTSASGSVRFAIVYLRTRQSRHLFWQTRLAASTTHQAAGALQEFGFDNLIYTWCRLRAGAAPPRCLDVLVWNTTGTTGGDEALIHTLYPARLTGVAVGGGFHADAAAGLITNTGSLSASRDGEPIGEIMTADLPTITRTGWDARVHGTLAGAGLELRSRRAGWISLAGDMTIEDRTTATVSFAVGATSVGLSGFLADTTWWAARTDPGTAVRTGGGELTIARRIAGFAVVGSAGVARSFYAAVDGTAPDAPRVGVRGGVSISRTLWGGL